MSDQNKQISWRLDNTASLGGQPITMEGTPQLQESGEGRALVFDGIKDGLYLPVNPLRGSHEFTIEALFMPYDGGGAEQRFVHLQEDGPEMNRILLEMRAKDNGWFLDTYLHSGANEVALYNPEVIHGHGKWYWAALSYDGTMLRHFVNGTEEAAEPIAFTLLGKGKTSIGVRINKVSWFKGAIKELLFHQRALPARELKLI